MAVGWAVQDYQRLIIIKYNREGMTDRRFVNHQHLDVEGARLKVQCRFCRHKEEYNRFEHVAPCGCMGATRFVHRSCLETWCTVKFEHVYNQPYEGDPLEFNVFCEMCQQKMEIEFSLTKKCSKYDEFLQKLEQDKLVFLVVLLLALASISMLVFIIIFASISYINGNLLAIVISVCLITLVADLSFFCWKFLLIKSIDIEAVANHKDPPKLLAFAQEDINNIQHQESYRDDPHFGQAISRTQPGDKSLMLESKRNSGNQKESSVQSKTFTDIVMRQMYKHDIPSERQITSYDARKSQNASRKDRNTQIQNKDNIQKLTKEETQQKQFAQHSVQVTVFYEKKEPIEKSKAEVQRVDKSIQMSNNQRFFPPPSNDSKSRNRRIFKKPDYQSSQPVNRNQISRRQQSLKEQEQVKQISREEVKQISREEVRYKSREEGKYKSREEIRQKSRQQVKQKSIRYELKQQEELRQQIIYDQPREKSSRQHRKQREQAKQNEFKQVPKFTPQNSQQQMEVRRYNIIKQKSATQEEEMRPTVKKAEMQKQPLSKQSRLKLKSLNDPIKIKIRF